MFPTVIVGTNRQYLFFFYICMLKNKILPLTKLGQALPWLGGNSLNFECWSISNKSERKKLMPKYFIAVHFFPVYDGAEEKQIETANIAICHHISKLPQNKLLNLHTLNSLLSNKWHHGCRGGHLYDKTTPFYFNAFVQIC